MKWMKILVQLCPQKRLSNQLYSKCMHWNACICGFSSVIVFCFWVLCGTCHMASSFLPLPRTPTSTICSLSSLLITTLTQRLALWSPSQTFVPLPSPLAERSPFLHLGSHPKILAKVFMPEFDFWLGITLTHPAHLTKGANTSSRVLYLSPRPEGTNASSGTSSYLHSWCTSHDLRNVTKSLCWELSSRTNSMFSHAHHFILRSWRILLQKLTFSFE